MSVVAIGAVVGGVGALASAGSSIYGSLKTGGKTGGGGGGAAMGATNPTSGILNYLLGYVPYMDKKGNVLYNPYDSSNPYWSTGGIQNGIFGNGAGGIFLKENIQNYINNPPPFGQEKDINNILAGIPGQYQQTNDLYNQFIMPAAKDLVNTGFRTDIQPVRDYALRQFKRQDMPTLAEMFSGQTGTMSTDFLQSGQQAAADMESQLGALQAQYDESANTRRAQGIPVLSQLATTQLGLGSNVADDLFRINQNMWNQKQQSDPGLRGLNIYQMLSASGAPSQQGPFATGQFPSQSTNMLSGLAAAAPGFAQAAGNVPWGKVGGWLGNLFTSNASMPTNSFSGQTGQISNYANSLSNILGG